MMKPHFLLFSFLFTGCSTFLDKLAPEEEEEDDDDKERVEGDRQGDCYDGEDNDDDGYIDCEDQGCDDKPACSDTGWTQPDTGDDTDPNDTDTNETDTHDTEETDTSDPVEGSLQGNTYRIDLTSATFSQPPGFGSLVGGFFENYLLMGIISDNNGQLRARGAISEAGGYSQDECLPTEEGFSTGSFSSSPYFSFPPFEASLPFGGMGFVLENVRISGVFASDGSYFEDGVISGVMDARDNFHLFEGLGLEMESASDFCGLFAGFGVSCESCSDGQSYCVDFELVDIYAPVQSGIIFEVTSSDIANNSQCN